MGTTERTCLARPENLHVPFWPEDLRICKYFPDQKHTCLFSKILCSYRVKLPSLLRSCTKIYTQGNLSARAAEGSAEQFRLYPPPIW